MRVMWVVFSKEFLDIIRDRRRFIMTLLFTFIFFPLLIIVPYSYLITRAARQSVDVISIPVQGMDKAPALIAYLAEEQDIHVFAADDVEALVESKEYPVGLIIPSDYEEKISNGHSAEVILVRDMRRTMDTMYNRIEGALEDYGINLMEKRLQESGIAEDFFTPITIKEKNVASLAETTGSRLGLFIPGLIISMGLSAGVSIAVSSIAGEKKKLTLEPVLFTTVSRFQLVMAKLLAVMVSVFLTLLSIGLSFSIMGFGVFLVVARNFPLDKLVSSATENATESATSTSPGGFHFDPIAIILFFLAPLLIILLGAAFQILISTWARNDEEATTYLMPLSLLSGGVAMIAFFLDDFTPQLGHYGIPILGTILSMRDLLSNHVDPASLAVMFVTSSLYALLMILLAVWMFQREEVVFRT
jgi:sodium transport system permease protein